MNVTNMPIETLKPYANNPRDNRKAVDAVAASIKQFGFKVPIVVDKNMEIVAGHTRYQASKLLGLKEVPCIIADDLTEEQIRAFRIADNKTSELASWDKDLLSIELENIKTIDMGDFGFDRLYEPEPEEDNYDVNLPSKPKAKTGDIYELGIHRVMCGDATKKDDVDSLLRGDTVNVVVTDPPYNVDYGSKADAINKYGYNFSDRRIENDYMPEAQFIQFLTDAFEHMNNVLIPGGAFYIFHASITQMEFEIALRANSMKTRQQLIWVKNTIVLGRQDYQWKHEPCLYGWKDGGPHYFIFERTNPTVYEDAIDVDKMKKAELQELVKQLMDSPGPETIVRENKPSRSKEHPTMKPIKLVGHFIRNSSRPGMRCYDPFGGSGSTLIACEQLERKCYMMELDPKYVDVIIDRWERLTGLKAKLVERA